MSSMNLESYSQSPHSLGLSPTMYMKCTAATKVTREPTAKVRGDVLHCGESLTRLMWFGWLLPKNFMEYKVTKSPSFWCCS